MNNNLQKLYSHRLRNLQIMVKLLRLAPYVRCIILNGSMATGKIKESSDIDLLIIAKSGRIYTCRVAVLFWATLTGLKRSNNENKSHAGKFCFNYFLTEGFLAIPHDRGKKIDKYCAENYSKSILLYGDQKLFDKYASINNKWMNKYSCEILNSKTKILNKLKIPNSKISIQMQEIIEKILSGRFGEWLEYTLKNIQIARIKKNPAVKKYPEFIVFNDRELRFHYPKSR